MSRVWCWLFVVAAALFVTATHAQAVEMRIDATNGPLARDPALVLPAAAIAPDPTAPDETCPGNSVIGAVAAATKGQWTGTWSDQSGWSLDAIRGADASAASGRRWAVLVNDTFVNDPPCQRILSNVDEVTIFPLCDTSHTACFNNGVMEVDTPLPSFVLTDSSYRLLAWQVKTTLVGGVGSAQREASVGALFSWPDGSAFTTDAQTDAFSGTAQVTLTQPGDNTVVLSKTGYAPDRMQTCVSSGVDGYCGTTKPAPVPFDPYQFCTTTGNDGYCNSPDHDAPVGHITSPASGASFTTTGPQTLKGTVDFDPSQTDHVNLKLIRKTTVTVTKYKKRKVWQRKRVHGKLVRKRVVVKRAYKVKREACAGWSDSGATWKSLKKCDLSAATPFRADGAEAWSYTFLNKLTRGSYTLQALAQDGAGNIDSGVDFGRNVVAFAVK
jgi:hypothetical protein